MTEFEIANAFDKFAGDRETDSQIATAKLWQFCEDHPAGQEIIGNYDLERKVREILSSRGWKISSKSSFLGEDSDFDDNLEIVLNNA